MSRRCRRAGLQGSPQGRDRYLELAPTGGPTVLHVVNSSKVNVYSSAYANLGRERFLTERLGALQRPTMLFGEPKNLLKVKHFGLPSSLRQPWRRLSDFSDWQRGLIVRDSPRRSSYKTSLTRALRIWGEIYPLSAWGVLDAAHVNALRAEHGGLRVFYGGRGIWTDKARTARISDDARSGC
jgi:hypothetical protein